MRLVAFDRGVDGFRVDAIDVISKLGLPIARAPFGVGAQYEFLQEMHERTFARSTGCLVAARVSVL